MRHLTEMSGVFAHELNDRGLPDLGLLSAIKTVSVFAGLEDVDVWRALSVRHDGWRIASLLLPESVVNTYFVIYRVPATADDNSYQTVGLATYWPTYGWRAKTSMLQLQMINVSHWMPLPPLPGAPD